jgi:hypothetical protein
MQVRLLRDWAGPTHPFTPAGAVVTVDGPTAAHLFHGGIAELVRAEGEVAVVAPGEQAVRVAPKRARRRKTR